MRYGPGTVFSAVIKTTIMDENKDKAPKKDEYSSEATVERGKKAADAADKLNKPEQDEAEKKKEREKDAEQWRNEG